MKLIVVSVCILVEVGERNMLKIPRFIYDQKKTETVLHVISILFLHINIFCIMPINNYIILLIIFLVTSYIDKLVYAIKVKLICNCTVLGRKLFFETFEIS